MSLKGIDRSWVFALTFVLVVNLCSPPLAAQEVPASEEPSPDAAAAAPNPAEARPAKPEAPTGPFVIQSAKPGTKRNPVREAVNQQIQLQLSEAVFGTWFGVLRFDGDIRVRYQSDNFSEANEIFFLDPGNPTQIINTWEDRERHLVRMRIGVSTLSDEGFETGIRLTTVGANPLSANDTMGPQFENMDVGFDLAYGKWTPPAFPFLSAALGRMENPFVRTDVVWDPDMTMEGAVLSFWYPARLERLFDTSLNFQLMPKLIIGAFPLQEFEFEEKDKYLFAGQVTVNIGLFSHTMDRTVIYSPINFDVSAAVYHYVNTKGVVSPSIGLPSEKFFTAPQFQQTGNTLYDIDPTVGGLKPALAADYTTINIIGTVHIELFHPFSIDVTGEYMRNIGYDKNDVDERIGVELEPQTTGYYGRIRLGLSGKPRPGRFGIFAAYRYVEADAILDAFTDSEFRNGGTNTLGYLLGGDVWLTDNFNVSVTVKSGNEIEGGHWGQDTVVVDMVLAF